MPRVDKREVLEAARGRLLAAFSEPGVDRVEYVVGFVGPYEVSVWLGTETDAERDSLARSEGLREDVARVLADCGLDRTDAVFGAAVVQSQETVDRDYEGSWFYALR
jgi:hypothetical protein